MGDLHERELTRLSFLSSALVSAPNLVDRLTTAMLDTDPPEPLRQAVEAVRREFALAIGSGLSDNEALRAVPPKLLRSETWSVRVAGQALMRAFEQIPRPRVANG